MKRYFTTLLDVFERVVVFANDPANIGITNSIPALQQGISNTLTNKVATIKALIYSQSQKNHGYATQKKIYKEIAANLAMVVINCGKAFAKTGNDETLYGKLKYSAWQLNRIKGNQFSATISGIINLLTPIQGQLAAYGVQPQAFTDVTNALNLFDAIVQAPRSQIEQKETINRLLNDLFRDANNFIRFILDPVVATLKDTQQQYYFGYRAARKHVPHGLRHNRINATVQDELGEPFVGVQVTVDEYTDPDTGKTYHAASGHTDINGMITVEDFWPGNRTISISGPGIISKQFGPFSFKHGKAVDQVFVLQPDFNNLPSSPTTEEEKEKVNK